MQTNARVSTHVYDVNKASNVKTVLFMLGEPAKSRNL